MTRDEKRIAIINKINNDIEHELKIADKMKFDSDKEKTEFKFAVYALSEWVNSDTFLTETYPNGHYIITDDKLNILMNDDFRFIPNFINLVIYKNKGVIYFVGDYCNDQTVKSHIIDIFDYIFYKKDHSKITLNTVLEEIKSNTEETLSVTNKDVESDEI